MQLKSQFLAVLILGLGVSAHGQTIVPSNDTNCNQLNLNRGPYYTTNQDNRAQQYTQHVTGNHTVLYTKTGECYYTGTQSQTVSVYCTPQALAGSSTTSSETGITAPYSHTPNTADVGAIADGAAGSSPTANANGAISVNSCVGIGSNCGLLSIGFSWPGLTASFSGAPLWTDQQMYSNTCTAYVLNPAQTVQCPNPNPPNPPYSNYLGGADWQWDPYNCVWVNVNGASPIIIDTQHVGWNPANVGFDFFTNPNENNGYLTFDIAGTGQMAKLSWPQHGSGLAWLALDDGSGVITNGKQLFGNFTPHSDGVIPGAPPIPAGTVDPNGFLALQWWDQPAQGGNGDGIIDNRDAIWPKLKLWIDEHCFKDPDAPCQSQSTELHTLESMGINSISLVYNGTNIKDKAGNLFKYYAVVNPDTFGPLINGHVVNLNQLEKSKETQPRYAFDVYLAIRGK